MKKRGRPRKFRIVRQDPKISQFSPRGRPGRPDEAELTRDELEAVRLADYIGMPQKEAARSMRVSQQTFSRIIRRARKLIADGLVGGKIIRIQGGSCTIKSEERVAKSQGHKSQVNPK